jgi:site-specific DNA recombinase
MMGWARAKRFQVLVVWKLDRLFRDTKLTLQTVDELAGVGIEVRSVQESFTHDTNGRFLLTIFAAGAEKERRDIALRMYSGRLIAAKRGTWVVGGVPFGYRYDPKKKRLAINEGEARIVRTIFRWLVLEKLSLYKVQSRLNELRVPTRFDRLGRKTPSGSTHWWAKRTLGRILTNEIYQGSRSLRRSTQSKSVQGPNFLTPNSDGITIKAPAIIPRSLFERARAQLQENSRKSPRRTKELYLLRGLLVCGHDNRRMQAARHADGRSECRYYFCSGIRKGSAPVRCPSSTISESRIAPPVWAKLKELLSDPETVLKHVESYRKQTIQPAEIIAKIASLEEQKKKALGRSRRLTELYLSGSVEKEFFQAENIRVRLQIDGIDNDLVLTKGPLVTDEEIATRARSLQQLFECYRKKLSEASGEVKRELLSLFVKNIRVQGTELQIQVNLPQPGSFAGQASRDLSRKDEFPIVLRARLVSVSEIFKQKEMHRNFSRKQRPSRVSSRKTNSP